VRGNRVLLVVISLVLLVAQPACGRTATSSPESVARKAVVAWYQADVDTLLSLCAPDHRGEEERALLEGMRDEIGEWYATGGFGTAQDVQVQNLLVREGIALLGGSYTQVTVLHTADGENAEATVHVEKVNEDWYVKWLMGPAIAVTVNP
jgi:hypothetical protein